MKQTSITENLEKDTISENFIDTDSSNINFELFCMNGFYDTLKFGIYNLPRKLLIKRRSKSFNKMIFSNRLSYLCSISDYDNVKKLFDLHPEFIDVNYQYNKHIDDHFNRYKECTPLHFAVISNDFDLVELLLEKGADVNLKDSNGVTPYMLSENLQARSDIHDLIVDFVNDQ